MKKRTLVHLTFVDHSVASGNIASLVPCEVFGLLVGESKDVLHVCSWLADGDATCHNSDVYSIARACVIKMKKVALK